MSLVIDEYTTKDSYDELCVTYVPVRGQTIVGDGNYLSILQFYMQKLGSPTGNVYAKVYNLTGTPGTNAVPDGPPTTAAIATSDAVDITTITSAGWYSFPFSTPFQLEDGVDYGVAIYFWGGNMSNCLLVDFDAGTLGHSGNYFEYYDGEWGGYSDYDFTFRVLGLSLSPLPTFKPWV